MNSDVDVVVVGLGPGGEKIAAQLAEAGLSVVGMDEHLVGGECRFYGCTPTKMMVRAADLLGEARRVDGMAGAATVRPDWAPVAERVRVEATQYWRDNDTVTSLERSGVTVVHGAGRLTGRRTVQVDGETYVARRGVVLATGTSPQPPPIPGLDQTPYWSNRDVVKVTDLPSSLIVIGGGPTGAELSQVFARFGVTVTLLEVAERILGSEEPESSRLLADTFAADGIDVLAGVEIAHVGYDDGSFSVTLDDHTLHAENLLVTAGRRTNLAELGLESVGLDPQAEILDTDDHLQVTDGLWAVGDITGKGAFTHVAIYQATIVTDVILNGPGAAIADYRAVPRVAYTDPEVAGVGLTEQQARAQGLEVRVGMASLQASSRGWLHKRGNEGLVKVVEDRRRGVLVGATVIAPMGGELVAYLTLAIHANIPTATVGSMIYAFPTFSQTIQTALEDLH